MAGDTRTKLTRTTITLHWIVGITIISLIAAGIYMEENEAYALYFWHKSFGVLIVLFVIARIVWRAKSGWPPHVGEYSSIEKLLSKTVHWLLIIGTVLMPVSGMMMSGFGGHGIPLFGIELMAPNPDPADPQSMLPVNETLAGLGHRLHGIGGNVLIAAIVLHVVGAIKHQTVDKDGTLRRMFGAEVN